jgi:hypothetical protein
MGERENTLALSEVEVIAVIGSEGGAVTVYGCEYPDGWRFFSETNESYYGEEEHYATGKETSNILDLLPKGWPYLYPVEIHAKFVDWFREQYDLAHTKDNPWYESSNRENWYRFYMTNTSDDAHRP